MTDKRERGRFIVVSGVSGAGKTIVLHALEDFGFYCVDNLPIGLLTTFADEVTRGDMPHLNEVAIGVDARSPESSLAQFPATLAAIQERGISAELLFVSADDATLVRRFSETRRRHPLSGGNVSLQSAMQRERAMLEPLRELADLCIDTSELDVHKLRELVQAEVAKRPPGRMAVQVISFGYKNGVPQDADFIFDMRCLPNPHWDPALRGFTGRDQPVIDYLEQAPIVGELLDTLIGFLDSWLPRFEAGDRSYMTIGIGCTGGRHRSVFMAESIARHLHARHINCLIRHRDL
ncbi:MAG: RNase adapter RapZ [Gammaproteobacteria bacterium]|nr:RNase adapter RapZ [Gammaproteobacteria bacterium]